MYGFSSFYFFFFILYSLYAILIYGCIRRRDDRKNLIAALFFPLFALSALRGDTVGGDLDNYLYTYDLASSVTNFEELMLITNTEPGFKILDFLISCISQSHRSFIIITSFLSLIGPAYLIYKYSNNPAFSCMLYYALGFYTNTFNNVRQSIALSICFLSFPLILNRKIWKFLFVIVIASTFHYSSLIFIIIYPLVRYVKNLKSIIISTTIGLLLFILARATIMSIVANSIFVRYDPDSLVDGASSGGWGLFSLYFVIFLIELYVYCYVKKQAFVVDCSTSLFFIVLQMTALLLQMYATMWSSMTRATQYFYIPIVIAVPFYLSLYEKKVRFVYSVMILLLSLFFMKSVYSYNENTMSNSQGVIPYVLVNEVLW